MTERAMPQFPFTAIVGSEQLKQALLLNVVDPRIGGVLIRGDRGTAKSTIVRALSALLPSVTTREGCPVRCDPERGHCDICNDTGAPVECAPRVVELPLGATEDRIVGSIDLARALSSGERRFEPGLLAAAHRGVLYIDEVNLLPDHLVDLLLDVAASGVNVVERDGASAAHPAEFILIGTMNPDEGELRPQLLDRFGLIVDVCTPIDLDVRAEVVRRRIAYDADLRSFVERFADTERSTRQALIEARRAVPGVRVPESMVHLIVELCVEARTDGLRPDITLYRAAAAVAAMAGHSEVCEDDVFEAALLVLPHRQRPARPGQPTPPPVGELVEARRRPGPGEHSGDEPENEGGSGMPRPPRTPVPSTSPPSTSPAPEGTGGDSSAAGYSPPAEDPVVIPLPDTPLRGRIDGGRRGATGTTRGRAYGAEPWDGRSRHIAAIASVAEATRHSVRVPVQVGTHSLRMHRRRGPSQRLVLLLVDGSGSMGAYERIARTKAGLRSIIERLYIHRDRVALQVFRNRRAELLVAPSRNLAAARAAIEALPTGGGTPLAGALRAAADLLRRDQRVHPGQSSLLVLITDGRTREDAREAAAEVAAVATSVMVIDTEAGPVRLGRVRLVADWLGASYEMLT
ncbi:MAG: VWA domain-containing protein [Dehalococcoidia bacterium]|nr:MAG: VWA domain-containing protein [Dehalococcoidia bacterium]